MNLKNLYESVLNYIGNSFNEFADIAWDIFLAFLVIVIGWFLGELIRQLFAKIDKKLQFIEIYQKSGFADLVKKAKLKSGPSELIGNLIKGFIFTLALKFAVKILGLIEVEIFLNKVIKFIPNIIIALFIILFTVRFSQTIASLVSNLLQFSQKETRNILAGAAKNIMISFGIMAALVQLKIADQLIQILFIAFVSMLSLAGGLAIGLGGKDFIHDMLKEIYTNKKNKDKKNESEGEN